VAQRTLILVKPDGVQRSIVGDVISRIERKGLKVVALELRTIDPDTAHAHYAEHAEKPFFGELVDFITSGPLVAIVAEGERAIEAFRALAGATDPRRTSCTAATPRSRPSGRSRSSSPNSFSPARVR
jgi:nucleoside-diphosphate kinase